MAFRGTLSAEALDRALGQAVTEATEAVRIDLGELRSADPTALLYLGACVATLTRHEVSVVLDLPSRRNVRNALNRYGFVNSLAALTDRSAHELFSPKSREYLDEPTLRVRPALDRWKGLGVTERALDRLSELELMLQPSADKAIAGRNRWLMPDTRALLERYLGRRSSLIGPGIVFEALINAAYHPMASRVLTTAFLDPRPRSLASGTGGLLTIAFWDDGESIVETLRRALAEGQDLRGPGQFDLYFDNYAVFKGVHRHAQKPFSHKVNSGEPVREGSDGDLLLAATFPGVTSDPNGDRTTSESLVPNRPGMGLYIMTSLAIDSFGGDVTLRAGQEALWLDRATPTVVKRHGCRYRADIVSTAGTSRHFCGNHIVVRLPLQA